MCNSSKLLWLRILTFFVYIRYVTLVSHKFRSKFVASLFRAGCDSFASDTVHREARVTRYPSRGDEFLAGWQSVTRRAFFLFPRNRKTRIMWSPSSSCQFTDERDIRRGKKTAKRTARNIVPSVATMRPRAGRRAKLRHTPVYTYVHMQCACVFQQSFVCALCRKYAS